MLPASWSATKPIDHGQYVGHRSLLTLKGHNRLIADSAASCLIHDHFHDEYRG
jgi:hypothetical protein